MTLYTNVSSNRTKTWIYLALYSALLLGLGYIFSWYYGSSSILLIAAVITIVQGVAGYWFADSIALAASSAVPLDKARYPDVYRLMENLSLTAGLPMPRLYFIDDTAMNAFATGRDAHHAAIAMTSGLIGRLDNNELQGVLAHELSHVGNEDIRLMSLVMVIGGIIALASDLFLRSMWFGGDRRRDERGGDSNGILIVVAIAMAILAPIAATLIQLAISRKREFMADSTAILITRYPEGLISALRKISGDKEPLEAANRGTAHMYFSNPLKGQAMASLFSTHPPIEQRIKALQEGSGL